MENRKSQENQKNQPLIKHFIQELMRKIGRPFLEICENLGNLRIAREFSGDHQKSNEANPMSSDCEADVEKEEHTRVKRPRSRCREGSTRVSSDREADVKANAKPMS